MADDPANAASIFVAYDPTNDRRYTIPFTFGDRVNIDDHRDIKATVTGFAFYLHNAEIRVEWFANGDAKSAWIGVDRLKRAE